MNKDYLQTFVKKIILFFKNIFADTPVQKWKVTNWVYAKVYYSAFGKQDQEVEYQGASMILPGQDTMIVPSIVGGYFEKLELDIFRKFIEKSKYFVDVGANVGFYTAVALKANPNINILAFEPVKTNVDYFNKNVAKNSSNKNNVKLINSAVGSKVGILDLFISSDNSAIHSASKKHSGGKNSSKVKMTTIDSACKDNKFNPDIIKIDIEGYDGFAVDGALKTLGSNKPVLFIEYDPHALTECGYEPQKLIKTLFSLYEFRYEFNQKKGRLINLEQESLKKIYANKNLLFCNSKIHAAIVDKFILENQ